jgi:hypothetical protein
MSGQRARSLYFIAAGVVLAGAVGFAVAFKGERLVQGLCGLMCEWRVAAHPAVRPLIVPVLVIGVLCAIALVVVGMQKPRRA